MAITNYLVHFLTEDTYNSKKSELRNDAVAFVKDATIIHTHGTDYYCGSGPVALQSDLAEYATTSALTSGLAGKANTSHTHTISQITDIEDLSSVYVIDYISLLNHETTGTMTGTQFNEVKQAIEEKKSIAIYSTDNTSSMILVITSSSILDETNIQLLADVQGVRQIFTLTPTYWGYSYEQTISDLSDLGINATAAEINKLDGVTVTTTELNYLDGVTSNIQTQLNGKAASSHTHSASDITSGTLAIDRIPTGTTSSTVALGNHTHTEYLPLNFSGTAQTITLTDPGDPYGTQSIQLGTQDNVLKETFSRGSATLDVTYNLQGDANTSIEWAQGDNTIRFQLNDSSRIIVNGNVVLTSGNYSQYITGSNELDITTNGNRILFNDYGYLQWMANTSGTENITFSDNNSSQQAQLQITSSGKSVTLVGGSGTFTDRVNATNGFYETSDARLKNFKDDVKALEVVSKIPTKYFTWKKDEVAENIDSQLHIGTSAQEIQKLYPDLVSVNEDGELSVDYARLSIIALAAIKELKAELDELKTNK